MTHQFDFAISNPPYQDTSNSAIFHKMQQFADTISYKTAFIYPADKWMTKNGRGENFDEFCYQQLHDTNLYKTIVYENANQLFPTIALHGGISMVFKNKDGKSDSFILESYETDGYSSSLTIEQNNISSVSTSNRMNILVKKVRLKNNIYLSNMVKSSAFYGIPSHYIKKSHDYFTDGMYNGESGYVRVLTNSKTGKGGRVAWFWIPEKDVMKNVHTIDKYKVAITPRNAAGYGGRSQRAYLYKPGEIFGDCRFCVGVFDNKDIAENFMTWMSQDFIRVMILSSSRRVKNFGVNAPIVDFANVPDDFTTYFIKNYGLNDDDMLFIREVCKSLGHFSHRKML